MARTARMRGVVGVVTDGMARDAAAIIAFGLPVFCRGVTPNTAFPSGTGKVGLPLAMGEVTIDAGDLVGQAKSITDLAEQEGVTDAYVCRLLPLTCLAPDILEAILNGRQPKGLRLAEVLGCRPLNLDRSARERGPHQLTRFTQPYAQPQFMPWGHGEPLTRLLFRQRGSRRSAHRASDLSDAPLGWGPAAALPFGDRVRQLDPDCDISADRA